MVIIMAFIEIVMIVLLNQAMIRREDILKIEKELESTVYKIQYT